MGMIYDVEFIGGPLDGEFWSYLTLHTKIEVAFLTSFQTEQILQHNPEKIIKYHKMIYEYQDYINGIYKYKFIGYK